MCTETVLHVVENKDVLRPGQPLDMLTRLVLSSELGQATQMNLTQSFSS